MNVGKGFNRFGGLSQILRGLFFVVLLFTLALSQFNLVNAAAADVQVDVNASLGTYERFWGNWGSGKIKENVLDEEGIDFFAEIKRINSEVPGAFRWSRTPNMFGDFTKNSTPYICDVEDWSGCVEWHGVYNEDENGNVYYDWSQLDKVYDRVLDSGMKPIVELTFMPRQLLSPTECKVSTCGDDWYLDKDCVEDICEGKWGQALVGPPKDWNLWKNLIRDTVNHLVERYGREEVEQWYFEVWNEPEHEEFWYRYSSPSDPEYLKLYNYAVAGATEALPTIKIGGLASVGNDTNRKRAWLEHILGGTNYATGGTGDRADFYSYHRYQLSPWTPADSAKNFVETGSNSLVKIYQEQGLTYAYDKPIIISEYGPATNGLGTGPGDRMWLKTAFPAAWYINVIHNFFRQSDEEGNDHYIPAEMVAWLSIDNGGWGMGMVTTDVDPVGRGVGKRPLFNAYHVAGMLGAERIDCGSDRVMCFATKHTNGRSIQIVMYRTNVPDSDTGEISSEPAETNVTLQVDNVSLSGTYDVHYYIIDETHSNVENPDPVQQDNLWVTTSQASGSTFTMTLDPVESNSVHVVVLGDVLGDEDWGETETPTFSDVPFSHWAHDYIEVLYQGGYVAGCNTDPLMYCPEQTMTRAESAVFVMRGVSGAGYTPQQPTSQLFADTPLNEWFAKWATSLWDAGYTSGCGTDPLVYCPLEEHTRTEGTVFFLRMMYGADYEPPAPVGIFTDVSLDFWGAKWIEAAYNAGLIPACETSPELKFCPDDPLDRAMGAYMMVQAKQLSLP
jgi:hypothetical protein